ncbi:hypothetical protein KO02_16410 [Sphingobacterium sp. ML3W]|uniref:DUF2586 family protein n=1 Tax=Sphingobacterium sp. ML3W TaxID=1538644 RepID=UPI0004F7A83D|nr:DUF2586 family protein [Sphingobacterium sp. ML3W]AIM38090.1 hypothetical protein KO02_16410 [Sphingobacterium sp. ML3W]
MAQLGGVTVDRLQGGLQRLAEGTDNHVAMIVIGIPVGAIATAVNNAGKGVVLTSAYAAEEIGINESFDANNSLKLHDQITEFFRLAPEATLYLFNSVVEADLIGFLNQNKEIKGYALSVKHDPEILTQVTTVVTAQQTIVNKLLSENRFIDFVAVCFDELEDFTLNLFTLQCAHVSVVVACEKGDKQVSIGSVLGMIAVRKISENLGSVDIESKPRAKRGTDDYTLTDQVEKRWLESFLSDGRSIASLDKAALKAIIDKGYIVASSYEGYAGQFFENSYTAIDRGSDYAFIENNRVWNKAARLIRATLLPRVKSKVKKDPTTGFIASTTVSYWQTLLEKALNKMVASDDISGFEVAIDYRQVVNDTNPVKVQALIVADGIVHEFEVAVGLTNNI